MRASETPVRHESLAVVIVALTGVSSTQITGAP